MRIVLAALFLMGSVALADTPAPAPDSNCTMINKKENVAGCDFGVAVCFVHGENGIQCFVKNQTPAPAAASAKKPAPAPAKK